MSVMRSVVKRPKKNRKGELTGGEVWRARFADLDGKQHCKTFPTKKKATQWLDEQTADLVRDEFVSPADRNMTVGQFADLWLKGYEGKNRPSSVRQARTHLKPIRAEFGDVPMRQLTETRINAWTASLRGEPWNYADSTVHAVYRRLVTILRAAQRDGKLSRLPTSRYTSPGTGEPRQVNMTTEEVWALIDAIPEPSYRNALLLGAFAGLRVGEACGLRFTDVNWIKGEIRPSVQYPAEPLKTDASRWPIPIPRELTELLAANMVPGSDYVVAEPFTGDQVGPWKVERLIRRHRSRDDVVHHALRHYFGSALASAGHDPKLVQRRMRHTKIATTYDTYIELWADADDRATATVAGLLDRSPTTESAAAGD